MCNLKFYYLLSLKNVSFSIDTTKNRVELSFRSANRSAPSIALENLVQGQIWQGKVKKVETYGLFIEIEGSRLSGLCHKSEVSSSACSELVY